MNLTPEELLWIVPGIVLVVMEFFLPGLVSVFLGTAAILVGLLLHYNILHGVVQSFGAWFILSTLLILTVRRLAARFFLSDSAFKYTEEDDAAIGQVVEVSETIHEDNSGGRIRFQGTDWPARTLSGTLKKGSMAVIRYRDNISWVVDILDKNAPEASAKNTRKK